jgi:hypothetical protein
VKTIALNHNSLGGELSSIKITLANHKKHIALKYISTINRGCKHTMSKQELANGNITWGLTSLPI